MLTARDTLDDKVTGLDRGADDYLVKPVSIKKLTQTVNNAAFVIHTEGITSPVYIRSVYLKPHASTFINKYHDLVGILHFRRQHGCHEMRRKMHFKPGGLV